ncbi:unnamed protein product [Haemonchus placei]|uniref:TIL domain-containing protein n=1 Tax=Haemonchus placei TaxID=6290 RepID=A0A0N4WA95_HAEPC|nr:unnamed protein product [Haemonchus placei]
MCPVKKRDRHKCLLRTVQLALYIPACGRNEVLNGCGALCEGKCENVNKVGLLHVNESDSRNGTLVQGPIPCPLICLPPACACRDGFYRDASNNCVAASQCPSRRWITPLQVC